MKKEDFLKGMTMMGIAYNKEYNQKELEVWYSMLGDYKVEDFSNAIQTLIKTLKRVPTIADITEQIAKEKTSNIPTAEDEWQEVLYAVRRYGSYREKEALESLKPYTAKIVGYIGYFRICSATSDEQIWNKKNIIEEYNSLVDKSIINLQIENNSNEKLMLNE